MTPRHLSILPALTLCVLLLLGARAGQAQTPPDRRVTDVLNTRHGRCAFLTSSFGDQIVSVGDAVGPDEKVAAIGPDYVLLRGRGGETERVARTPVVPAVLPAPLRPQTVAEQAQALSNAIYSDDVSAVAAWIRRTPSLLNTPCEGKLPLQSALVDGRDVILGLLLSAGADVNAQGPVGPDINGRGVGGASVLSASLAEGWQPPRLPEVRLLLDLGADVNAPDAGGDTLLHKVIAEQIGRDPQEASDLTYLSLLLARGADPNRPNARGETPLHLAVASDRPPVVAALLAAGADPNPADRNGTRPIHLAACLPRSPWDLTPATTASYDQGGAAGAYAPNTLALRARGERIEALLVAHRARLDVPDPYGRTPLWYALLHGDAADLTLLLPHQSAHDRLSPFFVAAAVGDVPRLAQGLTANADLTSLRGPLGVSLLQIAALWGQAASVQFLLAHAADSGARDALGQTPLHAACASGHPDVLALLLAKGGRVDPVDRGGATPLAVAIRFRDVAAVRLLLARHADPNVGFPADGQDPASLEIARLLLEAGADPNRELFPQLSPGHSLLVEAISNQNVGAVRLLLAHGADPNGRDGETPLLAGIANPEIVGALLDRGADAGVANSQGTTALMLSIGDARVLRLLLAHGAAVNAQDAQGQTALSLAQGRQSSPSDPEVMALLKGAGAKEPGPPLSFIAPRKADF